MLCSISLMFMAVTGRGEVLDPKNPSEERDTQKGKYDMVAHDQYQIKENLSNLQKQMTRLQDLHKEVDNHGTPSSLTANMTNFGASLEAKEKALREEKTSLVIFTYQVTTSEDSL